MPSLLYKAWAFIKRDARIAMSYQINFFLTSFNSLFILSMLWFIGRMVDPKALGLGASGGSYFAFALVGYGFYQYFQLALSSFSQAVQQEQYSGCLEAMVATKTKPEQSILLSSLFANIQSFIQLIIILAAGALFFHVDLGRANIASSLLAFLLSLAVFTSFGILSAAFIIVLKKGDPLGWALMTLNFVFGGAFFPVEQMPPWMRVFADFVPARYALEALRSAIIGGLGIGELKRPLFILGVLALSLFPFSIFVFRLGIRKARRDGSLVFY